MIEWSTMPSNEASVTAMFNVYVEEWSVDGNNLCSGSYAGTGSTAFTSGTAIAYASDVRDYFSGEYNDISCAYNLFF